MPGRVFSSGSYRFGFNGMEKNEEIADGNYDFGARMYDGRIGRWWSVDPLAAKYTSMSPYTGIGNNPIIFIDVDGRYLDLSNLSESERKQYDAKIELLSANKLFKTYYNHLINSETTYIIKNGEGAGGSGSFNPKTNEVHFIFDAFIMSQELFHAYQIDLGIYSGKDRSVIETEGDIISASIAVSIGEIAMGTEEWDQGIVYDFTDNSLVFDERVFSESFDDKFTKAVDARIEHYKTRSEDIGIDAPKTYVQKNSGVGALALKRVVQDTLLKEREKTTTNISTMQVNKINSEGKAETQRVEGN